MATYCPHRVLCLIGHTERNCSVSFQLLGEVEATTNSLTDSKASNNLLHVYEVQTFASVHEAAFSIELATDADITRTSTAQDSILEARKERRKSPN